MWCAQSAPAVRAFGGVFKSEGQAVMAGIVGICGAGLAIGSVWFAAIAHKKPSTMNPAWQKATAKYRAAQNQDPISNQ